MYFVTSFFILLSGCWVVFGASNAQVSSDKRANVPEVPDIIKKKNIPLVPSKQYGGFIPSAVLNGKHPVIHEFVSDRPRELTRKKKHRIPGYIDPYESVSNEFLKTSDDSTTIKSKNKIDKRFELYPKWFSNKVPAMLGKSFSRNYYYPFIGGSKIIRSRDNIARTTSPVKSNVHELPMSWLDSGHRRTIVRPHQRILHKPAPIHVQEDGTAFPSEQSLQYGGPAQIGYGAPAQTRYGTPAQIGYGAPAPIEYGASARQVQLGNAGGEVVDIPDGGIPVNHHHRHHRYTMRHVPYTMMQRMNPTMYEPVQAVGATNGGVQWTDYSTLRPGHRHYHKMNPCHHNPCLNHGHCHFSHHQASRVYHFKCSCYKGFQGHYCEVSPFSCHPSPCHHGGVCTKTKTMVFCDCTSDFKGHNCEAEKACVENPCFNDGICHETADSYHCECNQGWRGKSCEERVLMCESKPCKNGGTCHDLEEDGRFECSCPTGFGCIDCSCPMDGISPPSVISETHTEEHVEHATGNVADAHAVSAEVTTQEITATAAHGCPPTFCQNGGTCIRGPHGFLCNCANGFHGLYCDVPDLCTPNPCENNGVCLQDGDENYKCICPYGFKGTGCQLALSCTGHPCMNGGKCVETADSFQCKCTSGYKGIKCTDLNPCSHNPCLHKGVCFEKGSMYTCKCKTGFRGHTCQEKDPCFPNPCGTNGQCLERNGAIICKCSEGWMGDYCAVEDLCHQENHCTNGGSCVHHGSEFKCICTDGFHGESCELRLPCHDMPCEHGGMCEEAGESFVCKCPEGFHGERCHLQSHCYPLPCMNDGVCYESRETFVCECKHGFIGKICQEQKYCLSNPCMNGGHCTEIDDVFRCRCPLGFYGRICDINVCDHNPCRNAGTCMPASNEVGYACECVFPYHGRQCDEIDACMPNPCRHGGTCQSHLQHVQDLSFHEGPQFHGTDENVVSIVGPIYNETVHHEPYYNSHEHVMEFMPDEHVLSNEIQHFHMTADNPEHVYDSQLYHARNVDHGYHDYHGYHEDDDYHGYHDYPDYHDYPEYHEGHDDNEFRQGFPEHDIPHHEFHDHDYLGGHHENLYPNHRLSDDLGSHHAESISGVAKRTLVSNRTKRALHKKRMKKMRRRNEIENIPQYIFKIRNKKTSKVLKRTIHDLYVCQCRLGYLGAHCQHLNPCESNPCHNDGICVPRGELYQCQCVKGYGGANCDDPHPCLPNPCLHGGKCLLARNTHGYLCDCSTEWRSQNCESRDVCAIHNPCLHGGVCVNAKEADKVICKCRARFNGDRCETDKCANCDENAYCHHGSCMCKPDYVGNGYKCRAIGDVCEPNPCENSGICKHGVDGKIFTCECSHGYLGIRCELPNPCANVPCLHNGACIDESSSKEKGILMADRHDYKCFCTPGYRGQNCEETNLAACSSGPCKNNGFCFDASSESHKRHLAHAEDYECFCQTGFSGKDCEYEHYPCVSSPCMNGGHCLDAQKLPAVSFDSHGYKCSCKHGFAGRNCEVTVDGLGSCHSSPCMHDGRCVDIINNNDPDLHFDYDHEYKCFCSAMYSGVLCEVPYPACHSQPCQHNGTCFDKTKDMEILYDDSGYDCKCSPGFEGKNCERQYALNVLDDNNFDHALTEAALFDSLHPDHIDHDHNHEDESEHEHIDDDSETHHHHHHHHLVDDEDPYHGQVVDIVQPDPAKNVGEQQIKIVDHMLNEAHGNHHFYHHATEDGKSGGVQTTKSTPLVIQDSVAHHPRVSHQKFDFPNRNPSPTAPILLKSDPSFAGEANLVVEQDKIKEESASSRSVLSNPDQNDQDSMRTQVHSGAMKVYYGEHGRRSAIMKKRKK